MWLFPAAAAAEIAPGVDYRTIDHDGARFRVVTVDLDRAALDLVGQPGGPHTIDALQQLLGDDWIAATNAGIYHTVDLPVGLWTVDGVTTTPVERAAGEGNFYLRPNGIFTIDGAGARVVDTVDWVPVPPVHLATQSGPALVLGGRLHPRFDRESTFQVVRSGVGVSDAHTVHLVLSEGPVRFWTMATLFRDVLHAPNALYLDGHISGLWGPALPPWNRGIGYAGFLVVVPRTTECPSP